MSGDVAARLAQGDATLFVGATATRALGWLDHPQRYLGAWLDEVDERLPRRHERTLLLGMGGSSSPARLYAASRPSSSLVVLDTSNPDTIAATDFAGANVIASSKSGTTVETQTLLAHALAHGLDPTDLVVVTDPGTSLAELAGSSGALVVLGDPHTGGRFSALSPFGLVPALYAGWTPEDLRRELAPNAVSSDLARAALADATHHLSDVESSGAFFALGGDPISDGPTLWLEQLVAETTGKSGRGFIPLAGGAAPAVTPGRIQHLHLVAALLARGLGVDPFDQPDVDGAKREVFALLAGGATWQEPATDLAATRDALDAARYVVLQAFAPLESAIALAALRSRVERRFGPTTANLGPRYLHSTGQLHKGGPDGVAAVQVVVRPRSAPRRIAGRHYSFHDLHLAQARGDLRAMLARGRFAVQLVVDTFDEAAELLGLQP
ncbi:MAG: hypothetical protein ACHQFZ_03640 [Acidimicrobiales bacterium]